MIKINLLSPLDKENMKWEKVNNLLLQGIVGVLFTEIIFVAAFMFCLEYLRIEESVASSQLSVIENQDNTKEVASMEKNLKDYNGKINSIYSIQKNHLGWSFLMDGIAALVPEGSKLSNITVSDEDAKPVAASAEDTSATTTAAKPVAEAKRFKIAISGNAKTRDSLLALEDNLKKSQLFEDVKFADSNYVKSVDVDFIYEFYVPKEKLNK
jgi:Tfp pilus assembly protein PilN